MADEERPPATPATGPAPTGPGAPEVRSPEAGAVPAAGDTRVEGVLVAPLPRVVHADLAALNEAVPAEPPAAGLDRVGSIPQASATRVWIRGQLTNWRLYLVRFLCAGLAVVATVVLIPGLRFERWQWGQFTQIAIVFGLLNMTVKPVLQFLSLRFIFSTYGLVVVLINTLLLFLLGVVLPDLVNAARPSAVLAGGLLVGALGLVFETILGANPPVLDRDYKERNGLA